MSISASGRTIRTAALTCTAVNVGWIASLALARGWVAHAFPHVREPLRAWPAWFTAVPLAAAVIAVAMCVVSARPRPAADGWNGAAVVGVFVSCCASLVWAVLLLAQVTPAS